MIFSGIDWAENEDQEYVILDQEGNSVKKRGSFERSIGGIRDYIQQLRQVEPDPSRVRIGIDRKNGLIPRILLAEGYRVYGINPKSADRAREMFCPSGDKNDALDAYVHARVVCADCSAAEPLQTVRDVDRELREVLGLRGSQVKARSQQKQILQSLLSRVAPAMRALAGDLSCKWAKDLLEEFPLPQDLEQAHGHSLNRFFRNHGRMAEETQRKVRGAGREASVRYGSQEASTYRLQVRTLLRTIRGINQQIHRLESRISELVSTHPEEEIFSTLPVGSDQTLAGLCIAFGAVREQAPSWESFGAFFGVAPVTVQSGNSREVHMRYAYDRLMHDAFKNLAKSSKNRSGSWASRYFQKKLEEGKKHHHALRCLALKWVKIAHAMWRNRTVYDEDFHASNRRGQRSCAA